MTAPSPLPRSITALCSLFAAACANPSTVSDLIINLPPVEHDPALRTPALRPRLVVLQHGIWRSAWSLWRLERALEAAGYEVLNPSYPSTSATIEEHAARLALCIEEHLAERAARAPEDAAPDLCFVGHSMGGLVIRSYLAREGARAAASCVFIGTPHRGAALAEARRALFAYEWVMGSRAGRQLVPGAPFYATIGRLACARIGCLYGGKGDGAGWSDTIDGDDDGTVGVDEAQLPEQTDALRLPIGHTRLSYSDLMIRQVLAFLRDGAFER